MSKSFAEIFLGQVQKAMGKAHLLEKQIQWKNKWTPPKLVPDKREFEVDEEEFKQFETVVNFLRLTLFGACERTRLVKVHILDETRHQTRLPDFHVPNTPLEATERELLTALDLAQHNADITQDLAKQLREALTRKMQRRYKVEDRRKKAKDCEACDGKGWLRDEKAFERLERYDRDRARRELGGYNRVFCACQEIADD